MPSDEVWAENVTLKWDSGELNDNNFYMVQKFNTPTGLACLDELEANITWKGNGDATCKIVLVRNEMVVKEIIPFGFASPGYDQNGSKIHVLYSNQAFMG